MKRPLFLIGFAITLLLLASLALTAQAAEHPQTSYETPTPRPDGHIVYIVKDGDSCIRISLLTGVPVEQLRALNKLDADCRLFPNQELLIGIGGPSAGGTPTPGPAPTDLPAPPTPTAIPGTVNVCVSLYEDLNGDGLRQTEEVIVPDGAISISGSSGQYSQTGNTVAGLDPVCFARVPIGTYTISVAAPQGYNPTTSLNYNLEIKSGDVKVGEPKAGDQIYVDFGAQKATQTAVTDPASAPPPDDGSNLLGIAGGVLLLAGIGLAVFAWLTSGSRPKYNLPK